MPTPVLSSPTPAEWRRILRQRRLALPPRYRARAAQQLAARASKLLRRGQRIALYVAQGSEIDVAPLLRRALQRRCRVFFPVVPARGRRMHFAELIPQACWYRNRYGIAELSGRPYSVRQFDRVFMPLLGFDAQGNRLGQGGGYYDATLAFRRTWRLLTRPHLVGVAFECQRVLALHPDPWGVRLDVVLTECALYRMR